MTRKPSQIPLWLTLIAGIALCLVVSAVAHADRLYPYAGLVYHVESGLAPRPWAELGTSVSAGRLAPSVTLLMPLEGKFSPAGDFRVRFKF